MSTWQTKNLMISVRSLPLIHAPSHTRTLTHAPTHTPTFTHAPTYTRTLTHANSYMHNHTCALTHAHSHTHTHTRRFLFSRWRCRQRICWSVFLFTVMHFKSLFSHTCVLAYTWSFSLSHSHTHTLSLSSLRWLTPSPMSTLLHEIRFVHLNSDANHFYFPLLKQWVKRHEKKIKGLTFKPLRHRARGP